MPDRADASRPRPARRLRSAFALAAAALCAFPLARAAEPPAVGAMAPDFALPDQRGRVQRLSQYRGQWVVLYFYPKDGTPGCTTEACALRDNIFAFRQAGAQILGISVDDVGSKARFAEKHSLPFPVLADPTKETTRRYGVLTSLLFWEFAQRDTFLIDPRGRVARHWAKVDPAEHSSLVLAELKRQQAAAGTGAPRG
jgi:peroxiredoxin Q/BCP